MRYKVERFIEEHRLLEQGDKVLVAISGGADSVALLVVLKKLGYECAAIHCNFHLRDEESNRDEQFTKDLCERHGVALHIIHFDTKSYAQEKGISIEMAAREQRYAAFEEHRTVIGAKAIAVAHHRDDSAETLLLNLTRGTGIKGLRGIQSRNGHIIRPLLCVGRDEIVEYLKWRGESFVTDSTNLTSDYTRNKIRLEVIPKLAEINPSILSTLVATAQHISDAEKIYRHAVKEAIKRVKQGNEINIETLAKEVAPATILHEILSPLGFNSTQIGDIANGLTGNGTKQYHATLWSVVKDRERLIINPNTEVEIEDVQLPQEGTIITRQGTLTIKPAVFNGEIPKQRNIACLDIDKLHAPLTLRKTRNGDRFAPFGMRGTKLVSDYLTDRKMSFNEKKRQLVVTDVRDEIVWLVGERPSSHYSISKSTKNILYLEWEQSQTTCPDFSEP
ncbi:MAG: tRNA lysidine(34) synthetase TilS [Bacteroidaceae bacterium]|nr:tRNA lysidine(34) synthetase TilS [Bacteroidaceae bacterium]